MSYVTDYCAVVSEFEGNVPYLYLDTDTPPNPTTGVGFELASLGDSQRLAWLMPDGSAASAEEIAADWARVTAMPGSCVCTHYKCATGLTLAPETVDAMTQAKVQGFDDQLRQMLPGYDGFPDAAKIALLDMAWNLGIGRPMQNGQRATGLHAYTHLLASVNATPPDWMAAAAQCARNSSDPAFERRNAWTAGQFKLAAQPA